MTNVRGDANPPKDKPSRNDLMIQLDEKGIADPAYPSQFHNLVEIDGYEGTKPGSYIYKCYRKIFNDWFDKQ